MPSSTVPPIIDRKPKAKTDKGRGVIQFHILMRLAYKNLFFKKLRTSLTIMGVIIGIGSIVFLLSFGFGLQNLVSKQVIGSSSVQTIDVTSPRSKILKLNPDTLKQISALSGVDETGRSFNTAGSVKVQNSQTETVVYGADTPFVELSSLKLLSGTILDKNSTNDTVINSSLAKAVGLKDNQKAVGQTISVAFDVIPSGASDKKTVTKDFKIKGIFESDARAELFIPSANFETANMYDATQLKVVVKDKTKIPDVRKSIEALGFSTTSPLDTVDQINQVFTLLHFILLGFGGIGMIIAILGMFNTLTISLLERTREIGLMISLGARKQDVKRLFIVEALLLSLLGGMLGVFGAVVLGFVGNTILNNYAHGNGVKENISAFAFSPKLVLITIGLSGILGLLVVYFPARRASQTNPIEALHND